MRLLGTLLLAMFPFVVAGYTAIHFDALGASGGVLWCLALLAVLAAALVVAAHLERRLG